MASAELELNLTKFDMSKINSTSTIALIAQRRSGKSVTVRDIMYHMRSLPIGTVVCPTECVQPFYSEFIPRVLIHHEYSPAIVENVVKRQLKVKRENVRRKRKGMPQLDARAFLIMDDAMFDSSWTRDPNIRFILYNGRHIDLLFIICSQYAMSIPPSLRSQFDFVFLYRENIVSNRKRLFEQFAGMFNTFDLFCQVLDQVTEDFHCMVIDRTNRSNDLQSNVFWYKTDYNVNTTPRFKLCHGKFWQISNNNEVNSEDEEEEIDVANRKGQKFDVSACMPKSRVAVTVKKR